MKTFVTVLFCLIGHFSLAQCISTLKNAYLVYDQEIIPFSVPVDIELYSSEIWIISHDRILSSFSVPVSMKPTWFVERINRRFDYIYLWLDINLTDEYGLLYRFLIDVDSASKFFSDIDTYFRAPERSSGYDQIYSDNVPPVR